MTQNVIDLENVGSNSKVNIIVELDRGEYPSKLSGGWKGARRFLIKKDTDNENINSTPLMDLGKVDMSDPNHLKDFLIWTMNNFPAQKYLLMINAHGAGFAGIIKDKDNPRGKMLSIHDMATAIEEAEKKTGKHINVLGFDACFMGQLEVAYEMRKIADYQVSSQEIISDYKTKEGHIKGFALNKALVKTLKKIEQKPKPTSPQDMVKSLVKDTEEFKEYIPTMSGIKLGKSIHSVAQASSYLAKTILNSIKNNHTPPSLFLTIIKESQQFMKEAPFLKPYGDFRDLKDIALKLVRDPRITDNRIQEAAKSLIEKIDACIIAKYSRNQDYKEAHGISIFAPVEKGNYGYIKTSFAQDTKWHELFSYLGLIKTDSEEMIMPPP